MLTGLPLPFRFDTAALQADLRRVRPEEWKPHYNQSDYGGQWRGIALRSADGSTGQLTAAPPSGARFVDTPLAERCPYFREVMATFPCPLRSVRLLSLAPGSFIREHVDNALDYEDGQARIHVPIQTNPEVEFYVAGERLQLDEGSSYYLNVNLPHRVNNRGGSDRVHLVLDAEVDEWVRALFDRGEAEGWTIQRNPTLPRGAAEFRDRLFAEPAWQQHLLPISDRRAFERGSVALGRGACFDLHEGDVDAVLRGAPAEPLHATEMPPGWTPVRFFVRGETPMAEWIYTGERRFTEPFFSDTVARALRSPYVRFTRRIAPLPAAAPALRPDGLIFHISRCGSTLVSQMLAALAWTVVISEAPPIDEAVQAANVDWLRRAAAALVRSGGDGARYILKLDCWHIHSLPLFRSAFPDTPWVFIDRDLGEVLTSHLLAPGMQAVAGMMDPRILGLDADASSRPREEWAPRVLAGIRQAAMQFRGDDCGLFIDYRELPEAVFGSLARRFGLTFNESDIARMREVAERDSKTPAAPYQADSDGRVKARTSAAAILERLGLRNSRT